ncbi:Methionyl-tRNA synthetase [sediment metagenome]|uniref:Methionyl-tRNA synthetase n=1 Tax=sediment metagenome TaxID=749907 RepID=D9PKR8_9ZZZZ
MITIQDFSNVEMRIGVIVSAERVPETDKLLKLSVDFGEERMRSVISGIAGYIPDPTILVGKRCPFVTNLEPRTIRGLTSEAMIVAVHTEEGAFSILEPTMMQVPAGTRLN